MPRDTDFDPLTLLPNWVKKEKELAHMLPYVSLVDDFTVRTRGNEIFQCIRLEGVNSYTKDDDHLDKVRALFASIIAQIGPEFSFYVHKVSKAIDPALATIDGDDFAATVDRNWTEFLHGSGLRDKTLTLTVSNRPPLGSKILFSSKKSVHQLKEQTAKRMRRLAEVVGFLKSTFADMSPRLLAVSEGELLGFLGGLNTGQELPLFASSKYGYLAQDVANARITFRGATFEVSDGAVGSRFGTSFAIKNYPAKTSCTMFDELNLPVDMVVTHSFTPINSNLMAGRIKKQQRLMRAAEDGAISLEAELIDALDDLESKRLSFGDHHMSVTVFASSIDDLASIAGEVRNTAAIEGVNLVNEAFAARTHFFAQHPGNAAKRSRKAAVTNKNFADFAAFHRTPLGKRSHEVPWGTTITMFPTPERSAHWFNYHEQGSPDKEPTGGHTLILGRPGSGKSVLSAFLMTQAQRASARIRVGTYGSSKDRKGTILLFLGRFGYIERYGRVAKDFDKNGFSTLVIDWRSQGLSDRMADDPHTGHIHRFSDYQKDVAAMVKAAEELDLPKPWYLVGVSMGACIGLRAMLEGLPVAATALISPMFGIKMSPLQRIAAWPLSWAAQKIGKGHIYVPGESGEIYMLTTPFEKNNLTRNPDMYQYWVDQARTVPDLQIGGPSMAWLNQGLSECRSLSKMHSPDIPCIAFCGESDELVDNRAIKDRMERWPNGSFEVIKNAKHDVLTEIPEIGGEVMNQIVEFFSATKPMGSA